MIQCSIFLLPTKVDSGKQLERVSQLKLYRYQYRDGVMTGAVPSNEEKRLQVGVLAQELRQILPEAVHETVSHPQDGMELTTLYMFSRCIIMYVRALCHPECNECLYKFNRILR